MGSMFFKTPRRKNYNDYQTSNPEQRARSTGLLPNSSQALHLHERTKKPFYAKQTQFPPILRQKRGFCPKTNPIQTQFKANQSQSKPIQTQSNPIKPNFKPLPRCSSTILVRHSFMQRRIDFDFCSLTYFCYFLFFSLVPRRPSVSSMTGSVLVVTSGS